jgi:RNA polymerase sigma-70 factor (sigma-B/F/G subfamily)
LVTGHLPLAEHIATRFSHRGVPREDLVQVATVGLINAVDRFEPDRGSDFLSFAVPTIMGEVRRHFRDASWSMRVPRRLKELNLAISSASGELAQRLGRAPTPSEIAAHLGLSQEEVFEGLEAGNAYHSVSLDEALSADSDSDPLADTLGEEDTALESVENHESLRPMIEQLPGAGAADPHAAVLHEHDADPDRRTGSASPRCMCPGCWPGRWSGCGRAWWPSPATTSRAESARQPAPETTEPGPPLGDPAPVSALGRQAACSAPFCSCLRRANAALRSPSSSPPQIP